MSKQWNLKTGQDPKRYGKMTPKPGDRFHKKPAAAEPSKSNFYKAMAAKDAEMTAKLKAARDPKHKPQAKKHLKQPAVKSAAAAGGNNWAKWDAEHSKR